MLREFAKPYIIVDNIENGTVLNIAMFDSYEDANRVARLAYNENAFAEEYRWLVGIGDKYHDGKFWNVIPAEDGESDEKEAQYINTDQEDIASLKANNEEFTLAMAEMYAMTASITA